MQYVATRSPINTRVRPGAAERSQRAHIAARLAFGSLVASALLVSALSLAIQPEIPAPPAWGTVSVGRNATLWGIAEAHPIEGRTTVDTIELICAENGLRDGTIHAGQVLRVPVPAPTVALAQR